MSKDVYSKPITFAIIVTVVALIGTVITMFYPMFRSDMHPRLENLKPYTALQLAGKDIYQREGCNNCHTQTVRPLKTEVLRYGEYSKAGEFAYDRPFLWGSKRTGPDLARIGGKYPDAWHVKHFKNPQSVWEKSNMPAYAFLADRQLAAGSMPSRMKANGFPYTDDEIKALNGKTELDALVAYMQIIGRAVTGAQSKTAQAANVQAENVNPLAGDANAIAKGKEIFNNNCAACHGSELKGDIGPNLIDNDFLETHDADGEDDEYFKVITTGTDNGMPEFGKTLDKTQIWSVVAYIRSVKAAQK